MKLLFTICFYTFFSSFSQNRDTIFITTKDTLKNDKHTFTESFIYNNEFIVNRSFKNEVIISFKNDTFQIYSNVFKHPFIQICLGCPLKYSKIWLIDSSNQFQKMNMKDTNFKSDFLSIFNDSMSVHGPMFVREHLNFRNDSLMKKEFFRGYLIFIETIRPKFNFPEDFDVILTTNNNKVIGLTVTYLIHDRNISYNTLQIKIRKNRNKLKKTRYTINYNYLVLNNLDNNKSKYLKEDRFLIKIFKKKSHIIITP